MLLFAMVLLSWIGAIVAQFLVSTAKARVIAVAVAVATTEGAIWLGAGILGVSVFQARRTIFRRIRSGQRAADRDSS